MRPGEKRRVYFQQSGMKASPLHFVRDDYQHGGKVRGVVYIRDVGDVSGYVASRVDGLVVEFLVNGKPVVMERTARVDFHISRAQLPGPSGESWNLIEMDITNMKNTTLVVGRSSLVVMITYTASVVR